METSEAQQIIKLLTEMRDDRREDIAYNRKMNEEHEARYIAAIATQDEAVALQKRSARIQRGIVYFLVIFALLAGWLIWWSATKSTVR